MATSKATCAERSARSGARLVDVSRWCARRHPWRHTKGPRLQCRGPYSCYAFNGGAPFKTVPPVLSGSCALTWLPPMLHHVCIGRPLRDAGERKNLTLLASVVSTQEEASGQDISRPCCRSPCRRTVSTPAGNGLCGPRGEASSQRSIRPHGPGASSCA
jgi:hypothetical protein